MTGTMPAVPSPEHVVIDYPQSDGEPMSDGDQQGRQMFRLFDILRHHYRDRDDVYVGIDLHWYPIEGDNRTRMAPDVLVVPGRPSEPARSSWLQWNENGVAMRHVIEIMSPSNTTEEMVRKRGWYAHFGVEEFLVFDPSTGKLDIYVQHDPHADLPGLVRVDTELLWTSIVLEGCSYRVDDAVDHYDLALLDPSGNLLPSHAETAARADAETARADAEQARADALEARLRELDNG